MIGPIRLGRPAGALPSEAEVVSLGQTVARAREPDASPHRPASIGTARRIARPERSDPIFGAGAGTQAEGFPPTGLMGPKASRGTWSAKHLWSCEHSREIGLLAQMTRRIRRGVFRSIADCRPPSRLISPSTSSLLTGTLFDPTDSGDDAGL